MKLHFRSHNPRRRGFTLVELLVVIAIVVVLVAIATPMILSIRKQAGSAITVSNLRQIQTANASFASDNGGFFLGNSPDGTGPWGPPWFTYLPFVSLLGVNATGEGESGNILPGGWGENYPKVLKSGIPVSVVPEFKGNFTIAMNWTDFTHKHDGSLYGGESWTAQGGKIHQGRVRHPEKLIMFFEATEMWGNFDTRLNWKEDNVGFVTGLAFRNKGGRCNVVFADGHVGSLTREDIKKPDAKTRRYFFWNAD